MLFSAADRAALLRGRDPWEIRGFYELIKRYPDFSKGILAMAAPLLAEVREDSKLTIGRACRGKVRDSHLRRALGARDRTDLVHHLRRLVRMVGRNVNSDDLVKTVVYWGDHQRRKVAQDFFESHEEDDDGSDGKKT